jgi:hypothetical protein
VAMESSIFWDMLFLSPAFAQVSCSTHSSTLKMGGGGHVPPKRLLTFNGLHDVISQKIELFMTSITFDFNIDIPLIRHAVA